MCHAAVMLTVVEAAAMLQSVANGRPASQPCTEGTRSALSDALLPLQCLTLQIYQISSEWPNFHKAHVGGTIILACVQFCTQ